MEGLGAPGGLLIGSIGSADVATEDMSVPMDEGIPRPSPNYDLPLNKNPR
jgi:hypothetical protein